MEMTLGESSVHTRRAKGDNANDAATEAISTPQPPATHMRFDTLPEAEKHYRRYARRKGFDIRYDYRKPSEVTGDIIRACIV